MTDEEQFVPLFTCVPKLVAFGGIDPSQYFPKSLFPRVRAYLDTLPPIIRRVAINSMANYYTIRNVSRLSSSGFSETKERSSFGDRTAPKVEWAKAYKIMATDIQGMLARAQSEVVDMLCNSIPPSTRKYQTWTEKTINWSYGLNVTAEVSEQYSNTLYRYSQTISQALAHCDTAAGTVNLLAENQSITARYLYLGIAPVMPEDPNPLFPFLNNMRHLSGGPLFTSTYGDLLNGVRSLFCVVVKAKHRGHIMASALLGKSPRIPKADLQLWEDKEIEAKLGRVAYKTYVKQIQSNVRNVLHRSVVRYDNLTEQLFTIEKPNFATIQEAAITRPQAVLTRAKFLAGHVLAENANWQAYSRYTPHTIRQHL